MLSRAVRGKFGFRPGSKAVVALALFLGLAPAVSAQEEEEEKIEKVTPRQPALSMVFPISGHAGIGVDFEIRGQFLDGARQIIFESGDVTGKVTSASFTTVTGQFSVAPDAKPGPRYFQLITPRGASNLALFRVTRWATVAEIDAAGDLDRANPIPVPAVVTGRLTADLIGRNFWGEEADLYRFRAEQGQRLKLTVLGARSWTAADTTLTLMEASGRQLEFDDGRLLWDPYIDYTFAKSGEYIAAVSVTRALTAQFSRYGTVNYELAIGNAPQLWNIFPMGVRRGEEIEVEFRADFVPENPRLSIHSHGLEGSLNPGGSDGVYKARLHSTVDASLGWHQIYVEDDSGTQAPLLFYLGDLPERTESEPNDFRDSAERLDWPGTVNARIFRRGDQDWYRLEVGAGQSLVFDVTGESYGGSTLDSTLTLFDSNSKVLKFVDDGGSAGRGAVRDPSIEYRFSEGGVYFLKVESIFHQQGPDQIYRLTVRPPQPGFSLALAARGRGGSPGPIVARGETGKLNVTLRRSEGFDCEVRVEVRGLPSGVTAKRLVIQPGETRAAVELTATADAAMGLSEIEIFGSAWVGAGSAAREVTEKAELPGNPRLGTGPGFLDYRPARALLAVVEPTRFSLESMLRTFVIVRGLPADLPVKVIRSEGFDAPLEFEMENLPQGVKLESWEMLDEGRQALLHLRASEDAVPIRHSDLVVIARANGGKQVESAPAVGLQLD
jgi:hypothetical protein